MDQESLEILRKSLPLNASKIIAERTGKSKSLVEKVLFGLRKNQQIIEKAIALAEEHKEAQISMKKRIAELQSA
jgi:hypothetical protein